MISRRTVSRFIWDFQVVIDVLVARFREVLHKAVQEGLRDGVDEIQKNGALQLQQGWMHIHGMCHSYSRIYFLLILCFEDERNIPPLGRIGDPDDILATVLVEDGKVSTQGQVF